MQVYKRKIYNKLLDWKKTWNGKYAVLIEGPRRVGKSTVAEDFARREYHSYIMIDFLKTGDRYHEIFEHLDDLDYFFLNLQQMARVQLYPRESVIIFDEIQFFPKAREAIKYLVADGRYDYIETGSLISIKKNVKDIQIPSEEKKIQMVPMDYEEFTWAIGKNDVVPMLKLGFESKRPSDPHVFRQNMRDFRLYMLVGGMPQAVTTYLETNNLKRVDDTKRTILDLYHDDFRKLDPAGRINRLFDSIPSQLTSSSSSFSVSSILEGYKKEDAVNLLNDLEDSKTVLISHNVTDPEVGFAASEELSTFKFYVCDIGLFITMMFMDKDYTENIIYDKLLSDKMPANLGMLYENMVAQMLVANGNKLYYHFFKARDSKSQHEKKYEIDFLLSRKTKICPLEVKSSGYKTHASIDMFKRKYSSRIGEKYLIYSKDYFRDGDVKCLPIYDVMFL